MTQAELHQALQTLDIPVAYGQFMENAAPEPPFITYQFTHSSDLQADCHHYLEISNYQIRLFTSQKAPETEALLQNVLKELLLPYSKEENWLTDNNLLQITYKIQLIGG